jgi:hypothetical protein
MDPISIASLIGVAGLCVKEFFNWLSKMKIKKSSCCGGGVEIEMKDSTEDVKQ